MSEATPAGITKVHLTDDIGLSIGGTGTGGPASIADGDDVAEGSRADAAWDGVAASATVVAILKKIATAAGAAGLTDAELRAAALSVLGPLTDAELRAAPVEVDGSVTVNVGLTDGELRASAVTTRDVSNGTWGYNSGVSGTLTLTGSKRVLCITAIAEEAAASFTINGGDTITLPYGSTDSVSSAIEIRPSGNLTDPTIIFTGTKAYFVEYVS